MTEMRPTFLYTKPTGRIHWWIYTLLMSSTTKVGNTLLFHFRHVRQRGIPLLPRWLFPFFLGPWGFPVGITCGSVELHLWEWVWRSCDTFLIQVLGRKSGNPQTRLESLMGWEPGGLRCYSDLQLSLEFDLPRQRAVRGRIQGQGAESQTSSVVPRDRNGKCN